MNIPLICFKVFAVLLLIFAVTQDARGQLNLLKAGTKLTVSMHSPVGSKFSSVDDTFTATLVKPLFSDKRVVVPAGTQFEGRITEAAVAGKAGKSGRLDLVIFSMTLDGRNRRIEGRLAEPLRARSRRGLGIISALGGTAAGLALGSISGIKNGALIGAGIGAAAGTGTGLMIEGRNVGFAADDEVEFILDRDVQLPINAI